MQKTQVQLFELKMNHVREEPFLYACRDSKKFYLTGAVESKLYDSKNIYISVEFFLRKIKDSKSCLKIPSGENIFKLKCIQSRENTLIQRVKKVVERARASVDVAEKPQSKYKKELELLWDNYFPSEAWNEEMTISALSCSSFIEDSGISEAEIVESFEV